MMNSVSDNALWIEDLLLGDDASFTAVHNLLKSPIASLIKSQLYLDLVDFISRFNKFLSLLYSGSANSI